MPKLPRVFFERFGASGPTDDFGRFGSKVAGTPVKTKDIADIQSLPAWTTGWKNAIVAANRTPYMEDMNAAFLVFAYMLGYLFEGGVPEWDSNTTYYTGSIVRKPDSSEIYASLIDDNTGNALPSLADNANWELVFPPKTSSLVGTIATAQIANLAVTNAKINDVNATKLTGDLTVTAAGIVKSLNNSGCRVLLASPGQTITTQSQVIFQTVDYDIRGEYSAGTGRFTAIESGRYLVISNLFGRIQNTGGYYSSILNMIKKNGSNYSSKNDTPFTNYVSSPQYCNAHMDIVELAAGDYITIEAAASSSPGGGQWELGINAVSSLVIAKIA